MARQVLAWQCKYCGEIKKTRNIAERHEKTCLQNPDAKNCVLCRYSKTDENSSALMCTVRQIKCSRAVSADCESFHRVSEYFSEGSSK